MRKIIKRIIIVAIIIALAGAGIFAGIQYSNSKKTATVSLASNYGMSDYWGDSISSSGTVASKGAQSVYVTSSDSIASINVSEGEQVNEGDLIMTLKSESQDIAGKSLELEQAKATLTVYQNKLNKLMATNPVPDASLVFTADDEKDINYVSLKTYTASTDLNFTGSNSSSVDGDTSSQDKQSDSDSSSDSSSSSKTDSDKDAGDGSGTSSKKQALTYKAGDKVAECSYDISGNLIATVYYKNSGEDTIDEDTFVSKGGHKVTDSNWSDYYSCQEETSTYTFVRRHIYYDGQTKQVLGEDVYDMYGNQEKSYTLPTGYTATQLNDEIISAQAKVKEQDLAVRKCQSELDTMLSSTDGGAVYAKVTGKVAKLQDKDNINTNKPFVTITATEDFYIEGSIGEFYLDSVHEGDTATISSWESGVSTEATIISISDRPDTSGDYYSSSGNTNSSAYVFKASFDQNSGIEIGEAVDISITPTTEESQGSSFYLQSSLIRKDAGGSYVMKMNENNQLEKVYVEVGKNVYNYYTEIKSGITGDDYVAFPYGNGAVEGMNCTVADYLEE